MTRAARLVLGAMLVAACTSEPTGPQPGTLSVKLQDPNAGDGALLFTLSGPASPTNVVAASGDTVWDGPFTGTTSSLVVTGSIGTGVILTFDVPDVSVVSRYKAVATQAAADSGYSLRSLAGYLLSVTR